tara:strand:+ start:105 stop:368 length:264 start_codon:yes stop_codon:yes gene_type:complete
MLKAFYENFSMMSSSKLNYFYLALGKHFIYAAYMEKEIRILIKQYGTKEKVAKMLDITPRHLENVIKGVHVGKFLRRLINSYVGLAK